MFYESIFPIFYTGKNFMGAKKPVLVLVISREFLLENISLLEITKR